MCPKNDPTTTSQGQIPFFPTMVMLVWGRGPGGARPLGFGLIFPCPKRALRAHGLPLWGSRARHTSHTPQPRGCRAGHTPPSAAGVHRGGVGAPPMVVGRSNVSLTVRPGPFAMAIPQHRPGIDVPRGHPVTHLMWLSIVLKLRNAPSALARPLTAHTHCTRSRFQSASAPSAWLSSPPTAETVQWTGGGRWGPQKVRCGPAT